MDRQRPEAAAVSPALGLVQRRAPPDVDAQPRREETPMSAVTEAIAAEARLAAKYCGVSLIGFVVDVAVLHLMLGVGLEPAWARVISLVCAMHVTFVLNGLHVFRQLDRRRWPGQWVRYMACNAVGNICNYLIFVTMVSTHWPLIANPTFAIAVGSTAAWALNFATTRFLAFPGRRSRQARRDP
jgi:putative flippase GtrA